MFIWSFFYGCDFPDVRHVTSSFFGRTCVKTSSNEDVSTMFVAWGESKDLTSWKKVKTFHMLAALVKGNKCSIFRLQKWTFRCCWLTLYMSLFVNKLKLPSRNFTLCFFSGINSYRNLFSELPSTVDFREYCCFPLDFLRFKVNCAFRPSCMSLKYGN